MNKELEVSNLGETCITRPSPQQANQEAELNSIVKAIQKDLQRLPLVIKPASKCSLG